MSRVVTALMLVLGVAFTASAKEEGPATAGKLVAHYTFDEGSGSVAHDVSGNDNHGKIDGAKFVKHEDGYALRFDGVDDHVDCGNPEILNIHDVISIEAWVYAEEPPTAGAGILAKDAAQIARNKKNRTTAPPPT